MKKLFFALMCLAMMMATSLSVKAQEVTIYLGPGWTWISLPGTDTLDFATALGSFTPMDGDIIKSQWGNASYVNGQWRGRISQFYPGYGYKYYSTRMTPDSVTFNMQQPAPEVVVTTLDPTDITANSAICGGNVVSSDGNYVFVILQGICMSTNPNPTLNDNFVTVENGTEGFTTSMTDLAIGTTYYIRAFAVTANGVFYGEQKSFNTKDGIPSLSTTDITNITMTHATCGGNITDDGGLAITARGVCWSTSPNPTIDDLLSVDGSGTGNFNSSITGLSLNTIYYVRAYATNDYITAYGDEVSFVTLDIPTGAINGLFSVSQNTQVCFSQGNLQYQASTNTWKFADNQYDYIGDANSNISSTYSGWIDLFGWGTSGYNHGAVCYQPWSTSQNNRDYYAYGSYTYNLYDQTGQADWGYNPISNGDNVTNTWRTLTINEWQYVFNTRITPSGIRYVMAQVSGVKGVILLPDNWSTEIYNLNNTNTYYASFNSNIITDSQWAILENAGAIFLPTAGQRYGTSLYGISFRGCYWSASYTDNDNVRIVFFDGNELVMYYSSYRYYGLSVRLVSDAE